MEKELPKNWVESEFSTIISYVIGGDWGKDPESIDDDDFIEVLCIRGSEIKNWNENKGNTASLRKIKKSSLANRKLQIGDILLEISGGGPDQPVGRTVFIDNDVLNFEPKIEKVCTNFLRLVRIHDNINSSYINNYLQYFYHSGEIVKYQGGSNNLRNLKFKEYETISIPLPPQAEQNRIVIKLDTLFTQLETIKTSIAKVPLLLKDFKQQVLTQAVTGKLTEEWRKGKELEEWLSDKLENLTLKITDGAHNTPKTLDVGFPYLMAKDLTNGKLDFSQNNFISEKEHRELYNKCKPERGDLLVVNIGAGTGNNVLVDVDFEFSFKNIAILKPIREKLNSTFFKYYFESNKEKFFIEQTRGGAQPFFSLKTLKALVINLPPLEEQQEIVSRVESLFAKADAIEKQYQSLKAKIDSLPQAILHKAFKGELTEQLDSDGDARELLREIEGLKKAGKTLKSKTNKTATKNVKSYSEQD